MSSHQDFDLKTLRLFLAVVDTGSLGKAASREHLVPSAVSKRIHMLESSLGTPMLRRHPGGVEPTAAGLELANYARNIFLAIDRMHGKMSRFADGNHGEVRIFSNNSAMVQGLPQALSNFNKRNQDISVYLEEHRSPDIINAVRDGTADIGIISSFCTTDELEIFPYKSVRLVLITPARHPLALRKRVSFAETLEYNYVGWHERDTILALLSRVALQLNQRIKVRIRAGSLESLRQCVEVGLGVAIMPDYSLRRYLKSTNVCTIPLTDDWAKFKLNLCVRQMESLPGPSRLLADHLLRH